MEDRNGQDDLYKRLIQAESDLAAHHQVHYAASALEISALLASRHPYLKGDQYETALDLLDEAGATIRVKRIVRDSSDPEVRLPDVAAVASKRTGISIEDLLREDE